MTSVRAALVAAAVLLAAGVAAQMDGTEDEDKLTKRKGCFEKNLLEARPMGHVTFCRALVPLSIEAEGPNDFWSKCKDKAGLSCLRQCHALSGFFTPGPWSKKNSDRYVLQLNDCKRCLGEENLCTNARGV